MAVVNDPASAFDFAYKGFQYPLPPSWKYAVRQQDQIYWLLQALLKLNCQGVSQEELDALSEAIQDWVRAVLNQQQKQIDALKKHFNTSRNPVTGMFDYQYVVNKQMYDMLRVYACTWDELADTGMTWDEMKDTGHSWFEVDLFGNLYWGNGDIRAKYTPRCHIDDCTPGYDYSQWPWPCGGDTPDPDPGPDPEPEPEPEPVPDPGQNATSWGALGTYGFFLGDVAENTKGRTWDELRYHGFKYYTGSGTDLASGTTWDDIKFHGFAVD